IIIIAGDIFDSRDIKLDSESVKLVTKTVFDLAEIAPVAIDIGTPSHDGLSSEIFAYSKDGHSVTVATKPMQLKYCRERLYPIDYDTGQNSHAVISIIPTPTKQFFNDGSITESNENISQAMNGLFAGFGAQSAPYMRQSSGGQCSHILVGHWNVSGSKLPTGQTLTGQDIDIGIDQMMLADPALICLGHIHQAQHLSDLAFYSGSLYPLNWGEMTPHGFYIHGLEGKQLVSSEYFETPCRKLIRLTGDFTTADESLHYDHSIWDKEEDIAVADAFVRIDITCWQDDAVKIDKDNMAAYFKSLGALNVDVRLIRVPRQTVRSEAVLKVETLRDKLTAMASIKGETVPESILQKADHLEAGPIEEVIRRAA
ncbi:MAG: hypothetical protein WC373_13860, partial [Smithella sp.]